MVNLEMRPMSAEFLRFWRSAGAHLASCMIGSDVWLRSHPNPPYLDHLSFRVGNQIYFVQVVDAAGHVQGPGNRAGLISGARLANAHACLMPMVRDRFESCSPTIPGWGLLDAVTGTPLDPRSLTTPEAIPMSDWEVLDMAVGVVRGYLEKEGRKLMSWVTHAEVDPAIWFVGQSGGPKWVVVRAVRYPANRAARPGNWHEIANSCMSLGSTGHFASVAIASADQPFNSSGEPAVQLIRGGGMYVTFSGLE